MRRGDAHVVRMIGAIDLQLADKDARVCLVDPAHDNVECALVTGERGAVRAVLTADHDTLGEVWHYLL